MNREYAIELATGVAAGILKGVIPYANEIQICKGNLKRLEASAKKLNKKSKKYQDNVIHQNMQLLQINHYEKKLNIAGDCAEAIQYLIANCE